jgi:hypothetical protein
MTKFDSERDAVGVPRDCQHMGFSATEMGRLASEAAYQLTENRMMDDEKFMGVVRHVLTAVGAVFAYTGWTDDATWAMVSGSIATMIGFLWSWMAKAE